jgi:glycosyltransferase involved in cell wall biosynthesis
VTDRSPTRIALVLATSTGGVGQHVRSLALHLVKAGHRVVVCGPAATERLFGFETTGSRFFPVEIAAGLDPVRDLAAAARLRGAISGAEIVHAHGFRAGLVASLAGAGLRSLPLVVTWHNKLLATGIRRQVLVQLERRIARSASITLGASEDLVARALELGARDARFAPVAAPALPPATRDPAEVRREIGADGRPLILSVGRLHPQKRHDVLIQAAARWRSMDPVPLVAIAGSGPEAARLRVLTTETGAPVRFLGHRDDVPELLAACDLAVVTSQWEARQLFAQEALRSGRPVVATAVGGLPGLLGDAAELIAPGDPAALAAAVEGLLADPARAQALAERGRMRAVTWPSEADTAAQAAAVYAELLGRPA